MAHANIIINIAVVATSEKLYLHRDIQASRSKRKPDIDMTESCLKVMKTLSKNK